MQFSNMIKTNTERDKKLKVYLYLRNRHVDVSHLTKNFIFLLSAKHLNKPCKWFQNCCILSLPWNKTCLNTIKTCFYDRYERDNSGILTEDQKIVKMQIYSIYKNLFQNFFLSLEVSRISHVLNFAKTKVLQIRVYLI